MSRSFVHLLIAFLVLSGLVFLSVVNLLWPVLDGGRVAAYYLEWPMVYGLLKIQDTFNFFSQLRDIARQNQILENQVEQLTAENAELQNAGQENRVLRDVLRLPGRGPAQLVAAELVSADPRTAEQRITLNRGRAEGVTAGSAVLDGSGVMVGVIAEAYGQTSQMDLITASTVLVNARTAGGGATGVVRGEHGLGLLFDLVSQTEHLLPRDRVITSGLGGQFPPNLLIGQVSEIRSSSSDLFQKATVAPAANLHDLRFVFVVKKP